MSRMLFLRDIDVDVLMRCRACGHEGTLPRADLERRFGPGYPVLSLAPHFRCSQCHSRDVESRPQPTPDGPILETMVDNAVSAEVEDRFQSTLAALRGLANAAHDPDGDRGDPRGGGHPPMDRDSVDHHRPFFGRPPTPAAAPDEDDDRGAAVQAALAALRELADDPGDDVSPPESFDGNDHPADLPTLDLHDGHAADDPDGFHRELARISRLMHDDGWDAEPQAATPLPPMAKDDEWRPPAVFLDEDEREEHAPALRQPAAMPGVEEPEEDEPEEDEPETAKALTDAPMGDTPMGDTMAALRSLIQTAARDEVTWTPDEPHDTAVPPPPPARPDFRYDPGDDPGDDDDDERNGPPDGEPPGPLFRGLKPNGDTAATDQDLAALRALVEKAERDADRSTSAADIASVIPPDYRPPFWVETAAEREVEARPVPPSPPARTPSPPAAPPPVAPVPAPSGESAPRRKGSLFSRLRRRRSPETPPVPPEPPPPVTMPPAPASVLPLSDGGEGADDAPHPLSERLAALRAMLAGHDDGASHPEPVRAPAAPPDDDDVLILDDPLDEVPPEAPILDDDAAADFRRTLFSRLRETDHPDTPVPVAQDFAAADDDGDFRDEDIVSFAIHDPVVSHPDTGTPDGENALPAEKQFPDSPAPPDVDEDELPGVFGRFAIRDPDILFARDIPDDDEPDVPDNGFAINDRGDDHRSIGVWPDADAEMPAPARKGGEKKSSRSAPPAPVTSSSAKSRPDSEAFERTLATLRGVLGAKTAAPPEPSPSENEPPRTPRRRRKRAE